MIFFLIIRIFLQNINTYAWDFSLKGSLQHSQSDNVNSSQTDKVKDKINTANVITQLKNEIFKLKLKGRVEKYKVETANDNYSGDINIQYKRSKKLDFNLGGSKLVYNNIPSSSSDTSSNNTGIRVAVNYNAEIDEKNSNSYSLTASFKNYPLLVRKDKILTGLYGIEYLPNDLFTISPDISITINSSDTDYYKNYAYGPSLYLGYLPNDDWELSLNLSYSYTRYSGRDVSNTIKGETTTKNEYQGITTTEVGILYNLSKKLTMQIKHTTNKNHSNNSTSAYQSNILSGIIGFKF